MKLVSCKILCSFQNALQSAEVRKQAFEVIASQMLIFRQGELARFFFFKIEKCSSTRNLQKL